MLEKSVVQVVVVNGPWMEVVGTIGTALVVICGDPEDEYVIGGHSFPPQGGTRYVVGFDDVVEAAGGLVPGVVEALGGIIPVVVEAISGLS